MSLENRRANIERLMSGSGSSTLATCEACGGTHFYAVNVEQFTKEFGSVEYTTVTNNPKNVKICLCGVPLPIKSNNRGGANVGVRAIQEEFQTSLNGARIHLQSNSIKELAKNVATPKEVEDLKDLLLAKIAELTREIEALKPKETKAKDK